METITIPPTSVFVGHGYLQHAGDGYNGSHCLRYHTYLAPDGVLIPDAIHFAYNVALGRSTETQVSHTARSTSGTKQPSTSVHRFPKSSTDGKSTKQVVTDAGDDADNEDDDLDFDNDAVASDIPDS